MKFTTAIVTAMALSPNTSDGFSVSTSTQISQHKFAPHRGSTLSANDPLAPYKESYLSAPSTKPLRREKPCSRSSTARFQSMRMSEHNEKHNADRSSKPYLFNSEKAHNALTFWRSRPMHNPVFDQSNQRISVKVPTISTSSNNRFFKDDNMQAVLTAKNEDRQTPINGGIFLPPSGIEPEGLVVLSHGMGDTVESFKHIIDTFTDAGLAVAAYDKRGNGASYGQRGHWRNSMQLYFDMDKWIQKVQSKYPNLDIILFDHSAGAATCIGALEDIYTAADQPGVTSRIDGEFRPIKGFVFHAPLLKPSEETKPGKIKRFIGTAINQFGGRRFTYFWQKKWHPISGNTFLEFEKRGPLRVENAHKISVPGVIYQAKRDLVTDANATDAFIKNRNPAVEIERKYSSNGHFAHKKIRSQAMTTGEDGKPHKRPLNEAYVEDVKKLLNRDSSQALHHTA